MDCQARSEKVNTNTLRHDHMDDLRRDPFFQQETLTAGILVLCNGAGLFAGTKLWDLSHVIV